MADIICHLSPKGGIDERIASIIDYNKGDVLALRELYDTEHAEPLITPADEEAFNKALRKEKELPTEWGRKIIEAANKLSKYKEDQLKRHRAQINDSTAHMARTFNRLYHVDGWSQMTRRNRINMIATEFTMEVSRRAAAAREAGIPISREEIVNGYKSNGKYYDGQLSIFESIFDKFFNRYTANKKLLAQLDGVPQEKIDEMLKDSKKRKVFEEAQNIVREYPKILSNWAALCTFARMSLRDTEGLKLGLTLDYAAPTTPDNFSLDSPAEEMLNLEEDGVREAWMQLTSATSAYGSLGSEVRRFLSTITDVDTDGTPLKDDLGYNIKMDPVETHTYLADLLRGITSESGLIRKLYSLSDTDPKINAIFKALSKAALFEFVQEDGYSLKSISDVEYPGNPVIITQLLEDMHKNFVPYNALIRNKVGDIVSMVLNRDINPLRDAFVMRMSLNARLNDDAIYDKEGKMNWESYARWYEESERLLPSKMKEEENKEGKRISLFDLKSYGKDTDTGDEFWNLTYPQKKEFLIRASNAIGVDLKDKDARRILTNYKLLGAYIQSLRNFRTETGNANAFLLQQIRVLAKTSGIRPSERAGFTADEVKKYDEALENIRSLENERNKNKEGATGTPYSDFRGQAYGREKRNDKAVGAGNEHIYKMLDIIAQVRDNLKVERRISWFDRKGKANSRYSDVTPSYMGDLIDKIREFVNEGDRDGLQSFIEDKWGKSSYFVRDLNAKHGEFKFYNRWLQELYDSIGQKGINSDALAKVFQFENFLGSNIDKKVSIFENFTEKQHAEAMLKQFLQPSYKNANSTLAKYPCFILGDSGVQMFFTAKHYKANADGVFAEIMEGFKDIFQQEIEHQRYVAATNNIMMKFFADKFGYQYAEENGKGKVLNDNGEVISEDRLKKLGYRPIENYSRTENEFTMLTFLNPTFKDGKYWKILVGDANMSNAELKAISKETAMAMATDNVVTDAFEDAIKAYMDDAISDFKDKLVSAGILRKGKDGKYVDANNLFAASLENYRGNMDKLIEDFFWNTKYATIEQLQMFTVDPAFYDYNYPVKDLQKRYKEIYAPGKGVSIEARDFDGKLYATNPYERVAYFDDLRISSEDVNPAFWKMLEETFKDRPDLLKLYKKNTLTDGQGYRTLDSYRAVRGMAGEWTKVMEEAYQRIKAIRKANSDENRYLSEEDIKEIAQLATIFQPIKPYLYTLEKMKLNDNDMALIPVQHKYAEIVLIPELMKDGKLRDLALWMENHVDEEGNEAPIDMVCSTKCVKVGAFGSVNLDGQNTKEELNSMLDKAYIHNLSWSDYRIQTGVPEHLNHAQLFGTQIRKLILANIAKRNDYNYLSKIMHRATSDPRGLKVNLPGMGNVYLNGRNLISFYNCLIMANLFDSYDRLADDCSTAQKLSDKLIQNVISNTNQSEDNAFALSIIDDGEHQGEFVVPPGEPGLEHDSSALLWSLFKKIVNKQKIKGGSAVQASPFGLGYVTGKDLGLSGKASTVGDLFEMVSPEGDNVLYDEIEMPFNVSYTSATKKNVSLRFEDWCNTDGTLKLCDGLEGRPLKIVKGEDAREYLSWPVSGRNELGRPNQQDENGYDPNGYYVPLIEDRYPGVLDIVAYRIPTERDYSMVNCKVFRYTNPLLGGVMKVPSSRTTTAGFDFDIDKLYFFMRELAQTHLSDKQIEETWNAIYSQNDTYKKFHEKLREAKETATSGLGQEVFGVLQSMFPNSSQLKDLNDTNKKTEKLRDYNFWESVLMNDETGEFAELPRTAEEAFTRYMENNRDKYPRFDTYDLSALPTNPVVDKKGNVVVEGNSRVARNNMLLDLIRQRLMDKETLRARYTPGGFESNRAAALEQRVLQFAPIEKITDRQGRIDWDAVQNYIDRIKDDNDPLKDPEPEYDPSDPTAILAYNQQNQIAAKLIGIFANQNTNHVYASTLHEMSLVNPIKFGDRAKSGLGDFLRKPKGVDVDTNVAEYLAASVDAVKDPVLNFLNLNLITADAGAMLARIGYTPREIGLLFNQPVVKEVCDYAANNNVDVSNAIYEISKRYGSKDLSKVKFDSSNVTTDKLADNILNNRKLAESDTQKTGEFKQGQLQVLWLFNEIVSDAEDLNSFVQCTRFTAANSVGSTWGDMFAQESKVRKFIERYQGDEKNQKIHFELFAPDEAYSERLVTPDEAENTQPKSILNVTEDVLNLSEEEYMAQMSRNPLAFEQCMMDLQRKTARKLFGKYYPYFTEMYSSMRKLMGRLSKYNNLNADTINSLHREFIVYLLSRQVGSKFDGEAINTTVEKFQMPNRQYFLRQYPIILQTLKSEGVLENHPFFDALTITGDEKKDGREGIKIVVSGMGGLQKKASNTLTEMWAEASTSDDVVYSRAIGQKFSVRQLAEDLYYYNFYHLGYNFHPTSSMSLAPTILKQQISVKTDTSERGYLDFISGVISGDINSYNVISFAKQYILNHLDNKAFVYTPKNDAKRKLTGGDESSKVFNKTTGTWNTSFTITKAELGDAFGLFLASDDSLRGDAYAFMPVLAIEKNTSDGKTVTAYYMASSTNDKGFNLSPKADASMRYVLVTEQGSRGQSLQYFTDYGYAKFQKYGGNTDSKIMSMNDMSVYEPTAADENQADNVDADVASDGTTDAPVEVAPLQSQFGDTAYFMFSDREWKWAFDKYKEEHADQFSRDDTRNYTWKDFRNTIVSDPVSNRDIINKIEQQLKNGELKTIDDKGDETMVCPIKNI